MTQFQAYTLDFLPEDLNAHELAGDEIRIHRFVLEGWLQRDSVPENKPLLIQVMTELGITRTCCVGAPHFQERNQVYIPSWLMENLGIDSNSSVTIELLIEDIPYASMIYLKPLDTAIYHTDIRSCFEKALDMFHVIESGSMLTVEIESLGGYRVEAYVDKVEPVSICRLGGEVCVEFLEPEGGVPEFIKKDVPINDTFENSTVNNSVHDQNTNIQTSEKSNTDYEKIRNEVRDSWLKKFKKL